VAIAVAAAVAGFLAGTSAPAAVVRSVRASGGPPAQAPQPLPPVQLPEVTRPLVPAGILARAANARALERGPSCLPPGKALEASSCSEEERESIEIDWHAAREP
jgi:hypothetical protein